jgi:hypothetical protein
VQGSTGATGPYGGPVTLPYTFSTTTADADPGNGIIRLNNADVTAATQAYIDLLGSDGATYTTLIDSFDDLAQASVKGWLTLVKRSDPTAFVIYRVTVWTTATGYRKLTLVHVASSGTTPFADTDPLLLKWTWAGVDGAQGAQGATGVQGATGAKVAGSIFLSAAGMWPSTTNGASTNTKVESGTNKQNVYVLDFADGATKLFAEASVAMPSDWDGGTVTATFYWLTNGTGTGGVVWGCAGRSYGDQETLDQAFGTEQTVTDNGVATANQVLKSSATGAITLSGTPAAGEFVQFRVSRDPTNGSDTLAQTARLLGVLIGYTRT